MCRAFSELRQEIVILSQLRHPCLVALVGVSVRPSLLVVLELAPLGSLRVVLDGYVKERPFNPYHYQDKDKTFGTVLDRDITFSIVHQVRLLLLACFFLLVVFRVRTGHGNLEKSWNSEIKISRPGRSHGI